MDWLARAFGLIFHPHRDYEDVQRDVDRRLQEVSERLAEVGLTAALRRTEEQWGPDTQVIDICDQDGRRIARAIPRCINISQDFTIGWLSQQEIVMDNVMLIPGYEMRQLVGLPVHFEISTGDLIQAYITGYEETRSIDGRILTRMTLRGVQPMEDYVIAPQRELSDSQVRKLNTLMGNIKKEQAWLERWRR
jgi:hypothetical protein